MTAPPPGPLPTADPSEVGLDPGRLGAVADRIDAHVASGRSPAIATVIARHGKVVFGHTAGTARPDGTPLTLGSVFPIASQTKPLTAMVVMALVERGRLGLSEPAAFHLPELAGRHDDVLIHHLLTHTSGWHEDDHVAAREARLQEAIDSIPPGADPLSHILLWPGWEVPRRFEPGERMQYGNFNYDLLSEVIRRVTGEPLDASMRRFVFDPIGMTSSALIVPDELRPRVIERPPGIPYAKEHEDTALAFDDPMMAASDSGSGGGHATAGDLVRFGQVILDRGRVGDRTVISAAAVRMMTTNRVPGIMADALGRIRREASWGLGFGVVGHEPFRKFGAGFSDPAVIRHGGAGATHLWIDPTTGVVAAHLEVVTEADENGVPMSWIAPRVEAMVTAAVLD